MMRELFVARLKEALGRAEISGYRLAKESGLSQGYISNLLSGRRAPTDDAIAKIAPVIGISIEEMQSWADVDNLGPDRVERISRAWINQRADELMQQRDSIIERARAAAAANDRESLERLEKEMIRVQEETLELTVINDRQKEAQSPSPTMEKPSFEALDGFGGSQYPPTDEELSLIRESEELGVWFGAFTEPGFWDDPPEERRRTFRYLEGLLEEGRRIQKKKGTK